jgi:hypothetical protein
MLTMANTLLRHLERQTVCLISLVTNTYPRRRALKTLIKSTRTSLASPNTSHTLSITTTDRRLNESIASRMYAVANCYRHGMAAVIHIISTIGDIAFDHFRHFHDLPHFPASH